MRSKPSRQGFFIRLSSCVDRGALHGQVNSTNSATQTNSVAQVPSGSQESRASRTQTPQQPGQLPDTVSAPPFTIRDKFDYRVVQTFDLRGFAGSAVGAAIGQAPESPGEWCEGTTGFANATPRVSPATSPVRFSHSLSRAHCEKIRATSLQKTGVRSGCHQCAEASHLR